MSLILAEYSDEGKEWIFDQIRRQYYTPVYSLNRVDGMDDINYTNYLTAIQTHKQHLGFLSDEEKSDDFYHNATIDDID